MRAYSVCAVAMLLAACAQAPRFEDYPGPVTPISVPVVLQLRPVSGVLGHMVIEATIDGKQTSVELRTRLSITSIGRQTVREIHITEMTGDQGQVKSESPPLAQARAIVSDIGAITDLDIDFPYFRQIGDKSIPMKGSPEYAHIEKVARSFPAYDFPLSGVKTGDILTTPEQSLSILKLVSDDGLKRLLGSVRANSLRTEVLGSTWENGRQKVVIKALGSLHADDGNIELHIEQTGSGLIDILTGQPTYMVVRDRITVRKGGKVIQGTANSRVTQTLQ